jgi:hypothetical protein
MVTWKLVAVALLSLILLITCYLTLDIQRYISFPLLEKEELGQPKNYDELFMRFKKIKIDIQTEDDFKKINIPDEHTLYYFPSICPDYKQGVFITSIENGLSKYYVPEENHLILVKKDHIWTKQPDFNYWKLENA